jgi:hypothetical protein
MNQVEIYQGLKKAVDSEIERAKRNNLRMRQIKKSLRLKPDTLPDLPDLARLNIWGWFGELDITITFPWDRALADDYMIQLQQRGWEKHEYENDNRESDGEYGFRFHNPALPMVALEIKMAAKNEGSKCKLVQIGEETVIRPKY